MRIISALLVVALGGLISTIKARAQFKSLNPVRRWPAPEVGWSWVLRFTRVFVLAAALFFITDACLCPVLCLYADRSEHGSSKLPSPSVSTACGACAGGLLPMESGFPCPLTPAAKQAIEFPAGRALPTLASDIDHPPRRS